MGNSKKEKAQEICCGSKDFKKKKRMSRI